MKIINVVGARPNFMKIAPLAEEMDRHPEIEHLLVHTGQHYDAAMSKVFFEELGLPKPDIYLGIGSGSHAEQTARVMVAFEKVLREHRPDLVVVVGDVNSTLACSVTAAKLWTPVAHVEAGLRSGDRTMPEEINRLVTDTLSDLLFTTSRRAGENLRREGVAAEKIFFVPAKRSPLKGSLPRANDNHRLKMISLAIAGEKNFQVSDYELKRPAPSYTLATIRKFQADYGRETSIHWLIGADSVNDLTYKHRSHQNNTICKKRLCERHRNPL